MTSSHLSRLYPVCVQCVSRQTVLCFWLLLFLQTDLRTLRPLIPTSQQLVAATNSPHWKSNWHSDQLEGVPEMPRVSRCCLNCLCVCVQARRRRARRRPGSHQTSGDAGGCERPPVARAGEGVLSHSHLHLDRSCLVCKHFCCLVSLTGGTRSNWL